MDRKPETSLLDQWVGNKVLIGKMAGRVLEDEDYDKLSDPDKDHVLWANTVYTQWSVEYFVGYNQHGIELRGASRGEHDPGSHFVPWGAVLYMAAAAAVPR